MTNTPDKNEPTPLEVYQAKVQEALEEARKKEQIAKAQSHLPTVAEKPTLWMQLQNKASKLELIRNNSKLTIKQIVNEGRPSIAELSREYGADKVETMIGMLVKDLSDSLGAKLQMDEIEEIAVEVNSGLFVNITIEGFYMTLRKLKMKDKMFKLNVAQVLAAVQEHFDDHVNAHMEKNTNHHMAVSPEFVKRETSQEARQIESTMMSVAKSMHQKGMLKIEKPKNK